MLTTNPFWQYDLPLPASLYILSFLIEACLALWLFFGQSHLLWLVSTTFTASLCLVASTLLFLGVESCGCFGVIEFRPSWALSLDLLLLGLTCFSSSVPKLKAGELECIVPRVCTVLMLSIIAGMLWGIDTGRQLNPLIRKQLNEAVSIAPSQISMDGLIMDRKDRAYETSFEIVNHSDDAVEIISDVASCSCLTLKQIPDILPANSRSSVVLTYEPKPNSKQGRIYRFLFYIDHPSQFKVEGSFSSP